MVTTPWLLRMVGVAGLLIPLAASGLPPMPAPQHQEIRGEPVSLGDGLSVVVSNSEESSLFLQSFLVEQLVAGGFVERPFDPTLEVLFHLYGDPEPAPDGLPEEVLPFAAMGEEGYALDVREVAGGTVHVVVAAAALHGLFNGAMTLLGLLLDESGQAMAQLPPQVVLDYPDNPKRGGLLYSVQLPLIDHDDNPDTDRKYWLTEEVRARIDELARMKVNMLFIPNPTLLTEQDWTRAEQGLLAFRDYCLDRFIEPVFSVGNLRNSYAHAYRDGWWIRREPFHLETRTESAGPLRNTSFEELTACGEQSARWDVRSIPSGGAWNLVDDVVHSGQYAMRLTLEDDPQDPDAPSSTNKLSAVQTVQDPPPGWYGAAAWVKTEALTTKQLQVTIYGTNADGDVENLESAYSGLGDQDWHEITAGPVEIGEGFRAVTVYSRVQETGHGMAWIDDVRILPVELVDGGTWAFAGPETVEVEVAVPDDRADNRLANGGMETDADEDGVPDGWQESDPTDSQASWSLDDQVAHCGGRSARLEVYDLPAEGSDSSSHVSLRQDLPGAEPGHYIVSGWFRTEAISGNEPQLTVYTRTGGVIDHLGSVSMPEGSEEWTEHATIIKVDAPTDSMHVYMRMQEPGVGTVWADDLEVRRIDGTLQNVMRRAYDIKVESADLATLYQEGIDYLVRDGPLVSRFTPWLEPTDIVRLAGGAIEQGAALRLSYDTNLFWRDDRYTNQSYNICTPHTLEELYKPTLDRVIAHLAPTAINLNSDEIRGFNRSGACFDDDGNLRTANAELLASFFNQVVDHVHSTAPDVTLYAWDDMFSPFHNGHEDNQVQYGGSVGATSRAVSEGLLSRELRMMVWWYSDLRIYEMAAALDFFRDQGHPVLVAPYIDPANIADWAAMSAADPNSLGVLVTPWASEDGVPLSAELFWNSAWQFLQLTDFEAASLDELQAMGVTLSGAASWSDDGTCSHGREIYPGSNPGGVCVNGAGMVELPPVAAESGRSYRLTAFGRHPTEIVAQVQATWLLEDDTSASNTTTINLGGAEDLAQFVRSTVDFDPPVGPPYPVRLRVSLDVAAATAGLAVDNLMIWQSMPSCLHGDRTLDAPASIDLGPLSPEQRFAQPLEVCNRGCRDLHLDELAVVPDGAAAFATTAPVVPAGGCRTLTFSGIAPARAGDFGLELLLAGGELEAAVLVQGVVGRGDAGGGDRFVLEAGDGDALAADRSPDPSGDRPARDRPPTDAGAMDGRSGRPEGAREVAEGCSCWSRGGASVAHSVWSLMLVIGIFFRRCRRLT